MARSQCRESRGEASHFCTLTTTGGGPLRVCVAHTHPRDDGGSIGKTSAAAVARMLHVGRRLCQKCASG